MSDLKVRPPSSQTDSKAPELQTSFLARSGGRRWCRGLRFQVRQGFDLKFQRLIVLPLDLQLGLQFLNQKFEMRDLRAEFETIGGRPYRCTRLSILLRSWGCRRPCYERFRKRARPEGL
jgi:hypothetical protein